MFLYDWGYLGMFSAYFDESSDGATEVVCVVAGWRGSNNDFDILREEWESVLDTFHI